MCIFFAKMELIKVLLAIGFECIVGMKACYPLENSQNRPIVLKKDCILIQSYDHLIVRVKFYVYYLKSPSIAPL